MLDVENQRAASVRAGQAQLVRAAERSAVDAPPHVTRGERVPESEFQGENVKLVLTETGEVRIVPKRRGWGGDSAFVDWINFTFHETTCNLFGSGALVTDAEIILSCSEKLEQIFGFGVTSQNSAGRNFYHKSYQLGDKFGTLAHGGQRNTVLVMVTGSGLAAALPGWEKRLHDFLSNVAIQPRITRIDLAHDDFSGNYAVDRADKEFDQGLFNCSGRNPEVEHRGNWRRPNGKGRTLYVGVRTNGKYARVYEKGKQLGDQDSPWVRIEVELKSVDRVIPFDVLFFPGEFLAAAYPAFGWISEKQCRIKTIQKSTETSYAKVCKWLKHQCGSALAVVSEIEGGAEKAFEKVAKFKKMPARLCVPNVENSPTPFHRRFSEMLHPDVILDRAFS